MPSALHKQIAARIRDYAERRDISLNKLVDFAGVSRRQLSRILSGEHSPSITTLEKIAKPLGVSVRDLLSS